jgi:alkylation response protein AidB-like acyl-CoA dehydrogenase
MLTMSFAPPNVVAVATHESENLEEVRQRLTEHIAAHRPDMPRLPGTRSPEPDDMPAFRSWCRGLFEAGFIGGAWPSEYGGVGVDDPLRDHLVDDTLATYRVPRPIGAWNLVSAALIEFGSAAQRDRYLPRIRRFEDMWCQLFSEPDAGSDLAALRTTARATTDGWEVNGQKIWTTHAHVADLGFLLARSEPEASPHTGISAFIVDMRAPGVTVRPLREMTGSSDFNEVFLDNVHVAQDALIGERGQGWAIARSALSHERAASLREDSVLARIEALIGRAQARAAVGTTLDMDVRDELAALYVRAQVSELLGKHAILKQGGGQTDLVDAPAVKVMFSETNLELASKALDLLGPESVLDGGDPDAIDDGTWLTSFLFARGFTISAGSNEIMRNIIAERGLRLPRQGRG